MGTKSDVDRIAVPDDEKKRILDLPDMRLPIPEAGIYDGKLRYYAANLEWAKIIEGHVSWLATTAAWQDAEDEGYQPIQEILRFLQGVEMLTKEDICEAIECAADKIAKRIVSGKTKDFVVGEDGTVSDPATGTDDVELPEDDPETDFNETLAAKAGGAKKVVDYLQEILTRMHSWYSTSPNPSDQQAAERLVLIYGLEEAKAQAFATYWYTTYMNSQGTVTLNEATLDGMMFCKGISLKTFSEYIFEAHATPAEQPVLVEFVQALDDSLLAEWYQSGLEVPSTDYIAYSCTKVKDETFPFDMSLANAPQYTTSESWKAGHRFLVKVSGSFVDADVPNVVYDGMYEHNTLTGAKIFKPLNFNSAGGVVQPTQAQVPFEPSHSYQFTVDKAPTAASGSCIITADNGSATIPNVTGTLTVTIQDLGEFAL